MKFTITQPSYFAAASLAAARAEHPLGLHGVFIEPSCAGGVFIVAMGGDHAAIFHDSNGSADAPMIVPVIPKLITLARHNAARAKKEKSLCCDDHWTLRLMLSEKGMIFEESFEPVVAEYPNWRSVVPVVSETSGVSCYSARHLAVMAKIHTTAFGVELPYFRFLTSPDASGATIVQTRYADFFGVLLTRNRAFTQAAYSAYPLARQKWDDYAPPFPLE